MARITISSSVITDVTPGEPTADNVSGASIILQNTGAVVVEVDRRPSGWAYGAGFPIAVGGVFRMDRQNGEKLYALAASSTGQLSAVETGVG